MTGTKFGCGAALCGACTVHIDGVATRSCVTTIDSVGGSAITTIEAIGKTPTGKAVQQAWLDLEVVQCGYCQSGQIMSAAALLAENPGPSDADIDDAMYGNICRCALSAHPRRDQAGGALPAQQGGRPCASSNCRCRPAAERLPPLSTATVAASRKPAPPLAAACY